MNRKELKQAARDSLSGCGSQPRKVTLLFLAILIALGLLNYGISALLDGIQTGGDYLSSTVSSNASILALELAISFLIQLAQVVLTAGYAAMCLDIRRQSAIRPNPLRTGLQHYGRVILLYLLRTLYQVLWCYVFCIPLTIALAALADAGFFSGDQFAYILLAGVAIILAAVSYRYRMAFFVLMDTPELTARQALRQATAITRGHRFQLFLLDLSFLPWFLLCGVTCGILLIWKLPYFVSTYAGAYLYMLEYHDQQRDRLQRLMTQNPPQGWNGG